MSSKRHIRRRSCEHKQRHASAGAANRHRLALERQGKRTAVYACGDHWHVGRPDGRRRQSWAATARNREARA